MQPFSALASKMQQIMEHFFAQKSGFIFMTSYKLLPLFKGNLMKSLIYFNLMEIELYSGRVFTYKTKALESMAIGDICFYKKHLIS